MSEQASRSGYVIRKKKWGPHGVSHPAVFPDVVLKEAAGFILPGFRRVLDPFAGVGSIHKLVDYTSVRLETVGVEIEPEWADCHERTIVGDALSLPFDDDSFCAVVTSPTYGNRLADSYNAYDPHKRRSYRFDLGRGLAETNSGAMQWGEKYREFHRRAWSEAVRVIRPGGRLVLNVSDHIRNGCLQKVPQFHVETIAALGLEPTAVTAVPTRRLRVGANRDARAGCELICVFDASVSSSRAGGRSVLPDMLEKAAALSVGDNTAGQQRFKHCG